MQHVQSFGAWLKQQRHALHLTQQRLGEQAGCAGETIRKIEANRVRPSHALAQRLAAALNVPLDAQPSLLALARGHNEEPNSAWLVPTLTVQHATLPKPRTSLVGREGDVARLTRLLRDPRVRLVTLTGPPGVGKTRLAIEVATSFAVASAPEVWFVALAAVIDSRAVIATIAQAVNLPTRSDDDAIEQTLIAWLREQSLLLVLDNMEHLRSVAHQLARLLDGAPLLTLLVTSRTPLHLTGEHVWSVAPLPVRPPERTDDTATSPAVALFVERARAVHQDFTLDEHNAAVVATLCARLDGLPLAIELAAARSVMLSPQALLRRLEHQLDLLNVGPVDADARHQTLHHAIAWSYALLDTDGQALLRCLSVFQGGCRLELVQAVFAPVAPHHAHAPGDARMRPPSTSMLDQLTVLVEHSLVEQQNDPDGEPRFTLLATIHAFAREQAHIAGETAMLSERHAHAYAALLEWAEPLLYGAEQQHWFTLLDSELHNLRAALAWNQTEASDGVFGLRLATALATFWEVRGYLYEGRLWLEQALTRAAKAPAFLRGLALARASHLATAHGDVAQAKLLAHACLHSGGVDARTQAIALGTLGLVAHMEGTYTCAQEYYTTSLHLAQSVGDRAQQTLLLERLGKLASVQGDHRTAGDWFAELRRLSEQHGDVRGVVQALHWLGSGSANKGEYERAAMLLHESLVRARALDYKRAVGIALLQLGELARMQGQYLQAASYYEESRAIWQHMGQRTQLAVAVHNLGHVALQQEDSARALAAFGQSLAFWYEQGHQLGVALALAGCAGALRLRHQATEATRLLAAAMAVCEASGAAFDATDYAAYKRDLAALRAHLDDAIFQAAWRAGAKLSFEQAVAEAQVRTLENPRSATPRFPANLTAREVEVLQLLTYGLTNAEIAQRLIISPRTVNTHLNTIYRKLDVSSRSAATRFAVEHGLT